MGAIITNHADLARACQALCRRDARLSRLIERHGPPPLRLKRQGLASLCEIVVGQLVSRQSAEAIWRRLVARLGEIEAGLLAGATIDDLRGCGLSAAKAATLIGLGRAVETGVLDLAGLARLDDAAAERTLVGIKGVGPWTAHIYLLSCLGRGDVWPAGDLALRKAAAGLVGADAPLARAAMMAAGEAWRPWRAVAARILWRAYARARTVGDNGVGSTFTSPSRRL